MKKFSAALLLCACFVASFIPINSQAQQGLRIYFLDMMGGASTLIVTPSGESVLVDTGSREPEYRDADRIFHAAQHAGLKQIDYLITTHFHLDHFGGIHELTRRIPVLKFIDKGVLPPEKESDWFQKLYPLYQEATGGQTESMQVGDELVLRSDSGGTFPPVRIRCVAAEKRVAGFDDDIDAPVPGFEMRNPDESDNARSIALVLNFGDFDFFAGGDITWNVEHHLVHPINQIGEVDLYQVTHHGLDQSNNPLLLKALNPKVAIAMNGPRKGVQEGTFTALQQLPGIKAVYQMHFNPSNGESGNVSQAFIANRDDPGSGNFILARVENNNLFVSIGPDGPEHVYPID